MHSSPGKPEATKGYLRGSGLLLIGRFISLLTNFGVQVLSIRYLAKAQYGALAYALATVSTGTSVSLLGLPRAVNRFVPIFQEKRDYRSMFGTIFLATGTVLGFDTDGALLLREGQSGAPRRLLAGDVTMVGGYEHGVRP